MNKKTVILEVSEENRDYILTALIHLEYGSNNCNVKRKLNKLINQVKATNNKKNHFECVYIYKLVKEESRALYKSFVLENKMYSEYEKDSSFKQESDVLFDRIFDLDKFIEVLGSSDIQSAKDSFFIEFKVRLGIIKDEFKKAKNARL